MGGSNKKYSKLPYSPLLNSLGLKAILFTLFFRLENVSTNGDVKCDKAMHLKAELLFGKWQFSSQLQPPLLLILIIAMFEICTAQMWIEIKVDTL